MDLLEYNDFDIAPRGTACIKAEYLFHCESIGETKSESDAHGTEGLKSNEKIKRGRGKNRGRYLYNKKNSTGVEALQLCKALTNVKEGEDFPTCSFPSCKFMHNVQGYLASKAPDLGKECYVFKTKGWCPRGLTCRFGSNHITEDGKNKVVEKASIENLSNHVILPIEVQMMLKKRTYNFDKTNKIVDEVVKKHYNMKNKVVGKASFKSLSNRYFCILPNEPQSMLRKRTYCFDEADKIPIEVSEEENDGKIKQAEGASIEHSSNRVIPPKEFQITKRKFDFDTADVIPLEVSEEEIFKQDGGTVPAASEDVAQGSIEEVSTEGCCITDRPNVREKKTIDWKGKLYLAPMTTVGNLPFRRVCKEWGADVTCGEMALAVPILQGSAHEWTLLRRHESEDLFGAQICGSNAHVLSRCAQLIEETANIDFIDLNLSCPLELVYKHGMGSALLLQEKLVASVIQSLSKVTTKPFTVKTRTGVFKDRRVALSQMPIYTAAGVSLITVHGRTREQQYNGNADWNYIEQCAVKASPTPVFGNGDILSYQHYNQVMSSYPHIAGVMIGRGALYKPWIFTEIKEQRDWDISSTERLDILKKFVNYGFEHWGTDTKGIETTRRFLLEWLSFLYRYIPVGLLAWPPQNINERPPRYVGRNDLETLMGSPNCADWVKISEMLCGPVPEGFHFIPNHKASTWSSE